MISIQYMQVQSLKEQKECHGFQNAYFVLKWVIPRFMPPHSYDYCAYWAQFLAVIES